MPKPPSTDSETLTMIRICKQHAALVEALETLLNDIENNGYTLEVWGPGHPHLEAGQRRCI